MDELKRAYQILEVPYGAPLEEVQRKYRDLASIWHPDRFENNPRLQAMALDKLKDINGAYNYLAEYLKQHGPPPAASKNKRKEDVSEKLAREKARAEREAKAWAEARARAEREREAMRREAAARASETSENAVSRKKSKPLVWIFLASVILIAGLAAAYVMTRERKSTHEQVAVPSQPAATRPEVRSPPVSETPSVISPAPSPPPPQPVQQQRQPVTPAPRAMPSGPKPAARLIEKPPLHPVPAQPDRTPDFIKNVNLEQVRSRCLRHSPADWCSTVTERCREYMKDCQKLSLSDSAYMENAVCRGVSEWCYKNPQRVIHAVPELDERGTDGAE